MIINDPCFRKISQPSPNRETRDGSPINTQKRMYLLTSCFMQAIVIADSPERAKEMMVQHTFIPEWTTAEDIEIIITGKEQIVSESI